jgi:hypothetical protein
MKTTTFISLTVLLLILIHPSAAQATSCAMPTPCQAFGPAAVVFIGQVLAGSETKTTMLDGRTSTLCLGVIKFSVEEVFKGVATTQLEIRAGFLCSPSSFVLGERYVVYGYDLGSEKAKQFIVGSRTTRLTYADGDLSFLRSLPLAGVGGMLHGSIQVNIGEDEPMPLSGLTVDLEGPMGRRQVTTTDKGEFELSGLPPGRYTVTPILPENYVASNEYDRVAEVDVFDRGCAEALFSVRMNGRVSGQVVDSSGVGAPLYMNLVCAEAGKRSFGSYTEDDGTFEIVGVASGRYFLRFDVTEGDEEEVYFYPGVRNKEDAAIIVIGMGEQVAGYNLTLPAEFQLARVEGTVTYSDGRAASTALVRLDVEDDEMAGKRYIDRSPSTYTDDHGRFSLIGYKDVIYELGVYEDDRVARQEKRSLAESQRVRMVIKNETHYVEIVIPLPPRTGREQTREMETKTSGNPDER